MGRRSWFGVGGLGVAAAAVVVAPALHAGAATTVDAVTTPTTVHGTNFTQRWAFTWNEDDTNLFVDIQGMCVDARLKTTNQGQTASVQRCRFGDAWRFTFTSAGQIQEVKNGRCLAVPGAAANATVVFVPCDETNKGQFWRLSR